MGIGRSRLGEEVKRKFNWLGREEGWERKEERKVVASRLKRGEGTVEDHSRSE